MAEGEERASTLMVRREVFLFLLLVSAGAPAAMG